MATDSPLLTTNQVAELLQVHPKHVYRLLKRGLPARKVGGEWRFHRDEVLRWTEAPAGPAHRPGEPSGPGPRPPVLAANGDLAVEALLRIAADEHDTHLGLLPSDRSGAYRHLLDGRVLVGGHHGPLPGAAPTAPGAHPSGSDTVADPGSPGSGTGAEARADDLVMIRLVRREVGLIARTSWRLPSLDEIPTVRLATRPPTAGVRQILDRALAGAGVDPEAAQREAAVLDSHRDVVLAVTSGRVQTGVATRAWAARADLVFTPLATEDYSLLLRGDDLEDPRVQGLVQAACSPRFRSVADALGGYDPSDAGEVAPLPDRRG